MGTPKDIRGEIAGRIANSRCEVCNNCGASIPTDNPDEVTKEILNAIKEAGYVKLSKNQSLPDKSGFVNYKSVAGRHYLLAQRDMVEAGFRRVELEVKDG